MIQEAKEFLVRKVGPLPIWAWAGVLGLGVALYRKSITPKAEEAGPSEYIAGAGAPVSGGGGGGGAPSPEPAPAPAPGAGPGIPGGRGPGPARRPRPRRKPRPKRKPKQPQRIRIPHARRTTRHWTPSPVKGPGFPGGRGPGPARRPPTRHRRYTTVRGRGGLRVQ
jgi:hypothetical protein